MRQKTKNERNQGSNDKKCFFWFSPLVAYPDGFATVKISWIGCVVLNLLLTLSLYLIFLATEAHGLGRMTEVARFPQSSMGAGDDAARTC